MNNGRDTINTLLECHFGIPNNGIDTFDAVSTILLQGFENPDYEIRFNTGTMKIPINQLAPVLPVGNQNNLPTVTEDLWILLTNWWDTAAWAQREVRVPMEQANLLADLLQKIVQKITNYFGEDDMKHHYTDDVLRALIQLYSIGRINDPILEARIPTDINLDNLLQYYRRLGNRHGFVNRTNVFLQLLREKKDRNEKIHSDSKVEEYQKCCNDCQATSSFDGYIAFRKLNIGQHLIDDTRRLFYVKYHF